MPRKKKNEEVKQITKEAIQNEKLENIIEDGMMTYSMSVILDRAIPDVRDGLKPVHRRIIYAMDKDGATSSAARKKSLNTVGAVMGKYHAHGDSAIYDSMVRMAADSETLLTPLIDGKGNFGKHYLSEEQPAAPRYCVTGDTLVSTSEGFRFISDISQTETEEDIDLSVKSINYITKADKFFNSGKHKTKTIKLHNGMKLTGSYNHPVLCSENRDYQNLKWVNLEDIKPGDYVLLDLAYETCFGKNNDLEQAENLAMIIALSSGGKKKKIIEKIKKENIDLGKYADLTYTDSIFSGTQQYQITFFNSLLKNCYLEFLKSQNNKQRGFRIIINGEVVKYLQIILASNFGVNSVLTSKGLLIPNEYIMKFASYFNVNNDIPKLRKVKKFSTIKSKPDFTRVDFVNDDTTKVVYSLRVADKNHAFATNGIFSHNTEARLAPVSEEFTASLKKLPDIFVPNYDNTTVEPTYLPCAFPNILANPTDGIAVGLASKIPGFNLVELCDATIERIKHPRKKIIDIMPAPDFTTGEYILYEKSVMEEIFNSGQGTIKLRSKYIVDKKERAIKITGIPFSTSVEAIIDSVSKQYKNGKLREITNIENTTGLNGMEITIDYKKDVDPDKLMSKLFAITPLQSTYSCNFNVLIDNAPRSVGVYNILDSWIANRRIDVEKELKYDLKAKEDSLHLLEALDKILLDIDKCIKIIRKSKDDEEAIHGLMKGFKIDKIQAEYVADIKLRNLNKDYILNKTKRIKDLKEEIKQLKQDIKSGIDKFIIKQLKEISKKYGQPRKAEIIYDFTDVSSKEFDKKENFASKFIYTKDGYLKKIPLDNFKESSLKFKSGDSEKFSFDGDENSEILLFSNTGRVHKLYGSKIKNQKPSDVGDLIFSLVDLDPGEDILFINPLIPGWFVLAFENGKVVKIPSSSYETETMRKVLKNGYNKKQKLVDIYFTSNNEDVFTIKSNQDKYISFPLSLIPERTTTSSDGVYVLRAKGALISEFKNTSKGDKYLVKRVPVSGIK